jgi:hypothetical protein
VDATAIYPAKNRLQQEAAGIYKKLQDFMKTVFLQEYVALRYWLYEACLNRVSTKILCITLEKI